MANILSDLNIDPRLILVNIAGFGALYAIAKKLVFDPIGTLLTSRETEIASTYDRLDADQREMQRLKSDYESRLEAIESEAREKISAAIKEAQATRDKIVSDATVQAREIVAQFTQRGSHEDEAWCLRTHQERLRERSRIGIRGCAQDDRPFRIEVRSGRKLTGH